MPHQLVQGRSSRLPMKPAGTGQRRGQGEVAHPSRAQAKGESRQRTRGSRGWKERRSF